MITLLHQRGRLTYRTLKRQFELDNVALDDLKEELIYGQRLTVDEDERVLIWIGDAAATTPPASGRALVLDTGQARVPLAYTPPYLAEKILTSRSALEGERKQVTVLFADLKGSMELLADRDLEEARQLLDPVLERMMAAVHRYEGTVNQVMGDGIMALFGAPLTHEDHAVRACYAALAMQAAVQRYATEVQRTHGVPIQMRVGLNAGEAVVRAIGNDLHMAYSALGQTTHFAARIAYQAQGDYRRAIDFLGQTVVFFDGAWRYEHFGQVVLPTVISRVWLAWCHAELGMFAEGRALGDEGLQIAEAIEHSIRRNCASIPSG